MDESQPQASCELRLLTVGDVAERFHGGGLRLTEDTLRRRALGEEEVAGFLRGFPPALLTVWEHGAPAATLKTAWWSGAWPAREDAWWVLDGAGWVTALLRIVARDEVSAGWQDQVVPVCIVRGRGAAVRAVLEHVRRTKRSPTTSVAQLPIRGRASGRTVAGLAVALSREGFGTLREALVARCVTAILGKDPGGPLAAQVHRPIDGELHDRCATALRRALVFLQSRARVPHVATLSYGLHLVVLSRFFDMHPSAHPRNQMLLTRWYWRYVLATSEGGPAMAIRRMQGCVTEDEHGSVQALLREVPHLRPTPEECWAGVRRNRKLLAVALASFAPRDTAGGERVALAAHLNAPPRSWFVQITASAGVGGHGRDTLLLHPHCAPGELQRALMGASSEVLVSHCVPEDARDALLRGDVAAFVSSREAALRSRVEHFTDSLAAWGASDRPPISALHVAEVER